MSRSIHTTHKTLATLGKKKFESAKARKAAKIWAGVRPFPGAATSSAQNALD